MAKASPQSMGFVAPCREVARPAAADYAIWQESVIGLLHQQAECAMRHVKIVQAWPR